MSSNKEHAVENLKRRLIDDVRYKEGIKQCLDSPQVLIAPTNYCNLACEYCSTKDVRNIKVNMDLELLKSIVRQAAANKWSMFFGQTYEPFIHPKINEIVDFVNAQGGRFNSATNGMAIREKSYDLTMNLLLSFSATEEDYAYRNSAVPYEKYLARQYKFLKHRIGNTVPGQISIQIADYTIFDGNMAYDKKMVDLSGIIEKSEMIAKALGLKLDFDANDWMDRVANRSPLPLFTSGETIIQVQPTKIVPNSYDAFVAIEDTSEAKGYCDSCYTMMSIQADGKVAYCCCDPSANAIAGTIDSGTDLKGFWLGKEMAAVRNGFNDFKPIHSFCTKCLSNVTEHIKPLLTSKNPKNVAEILRDYGIRDDQPWFKFPER